MKKYICENCGNEHDGSYGSGRFCSKTCRGAFVAKDQHTGCKSNKKWICRICNMIFTSRQKMYDHLHNFHNQHGIWNKGQTIDTDPILKKQIEKLCEGYKSGRIKPSFLGRHLTKEHKDKMISTYIQNRTDNKYRGNYKGIYFQYSFELAWLVWNFEHGIKVFRCDKTFQYWDSKQQKERTYYPDFELEDGTIIEIKGIMNQNVLDKQKAVLEQYNGKYLILQENDIKHCLEYCKEKYGNNFIQKLKDL